MGATISAADFAISCFTNSPNSEALERLTAFLEARAQTYRVWRVLLEQFVSLETDQVEDEEDDASATAVERDAVGPQQPSRVAHAGSASGPRKGIHVVAAREGRRLE